MKNKLIGLTVALAATNFAYAEDYQVDVGAFYSDASDVNVTAMGVGLEYHFKAVDTSDKPLAEAAFLNHSSNITAAVARTEIEFSGFEADATITAIGAEFYVPNSVFYLGANYTDPDQGDGYFDVTAGLYFDSLLVTTTYVEDVDYELNLQAKYVNQLGGGKAVALSGSFYDGDGGNIISAGLDYYFTHQTSVGATLTDYDGENEFEVRARHFFTGTVYAGISYADIDNSSEITIDAGMRF